MLTGLSTLSANLISVCSFCSFSSGVASVNAHDKQAIAQTVYLFHEYTLKDILKTAGSERVAILRGPGFKYTFFLLYFLLWRPLWFASGFFRLGSG